MDDSNFKIEDIKIETAEDYQTQSEINDLRQHANKIIQGIKKLDTTDAHRAIWELFQNAVDLSKDCHVKIKLTENTLEFSHNGEPFTPMTLDCLFKQVSSKTLEEKKIEHDAADPVGQYGTGFMTTHIFGKELVIDGALIKGDGYITLNRFIINRFTENWKELAWRIRELKKDVSSLLAREEINQPPFPDTTFTYKTSTKPNHDYAVATIASLRMILPYVMTLNSKLNSVSVTDMDGNITVYKKGETYENNGLHIRPININYEKQEVCYLQAEEEKIVIILPVKPDLSTINLDEKLPRLFLYYPLIGTQNFGINFIIHSRNFQPTEPRNGLFLKSDNDLNEKDEKTNRDLLEKASTIIFNFLTTNTNRISNPINLATINFNINNDNNPLLNTYYRELKDKWIGEFKTYALVETTEGNIEPEKALFLNDELLVNTYPNSDENEKCFTAIHEVANQFWKNIPLKNLTKEWTRIINEWNVGTNQIIYIKNIVGKIQESSHLSAFSNSENLKTFYRYLISIGHTGLFNDFKLLPNIKGEFRQLAGKEGLNSSLNLPQMLIEIADVIMPDIPKRHVDPAFKFTLEFSEYSRKNFATDINDHLSKLIGEKAESGTISETVLIKLIEYCKISPSIESTSVPNQLMKLISKYYNRVEDLIELPTVKDDDLDLRVPQRRLLRMFLNDISKKETSWVAENLDLLKNVISLGSGYADYEEMFQTVAVFPNQLNELNLQSYLSIDENIPKDIKDLYDKVVKPGRPIRANLVQDGFEDDLKNKQKKTVKELAEKIEGALFDEQNQYSINDHPFKKEILEIIEKIKDPASGYGKYFKLIFSKRSGILVELADGEDTFSILSLEPRKIKKLAQLGNNPDFETIVKLGEDALNRQRQESATFEYKRHIGTRIEAVIRERLSHIVGMRITKPDLNEALTDFSAVDEQVGQDIVIYLGDDPIYYIEVKSRWAEGTPFRISKRQTIRAFDHPDNYSLVTVDMLKSILQNKYKVTDISEIEDVIKVNNDIGNKLDGNLITQYIDSENAETFHIDGDFRTYIPQSYVDTGTTFKVFEDYIINVLQKKYENESNQRTST
jgi:hypothetical protein